MAQPNNQKLTDFQVLTFDVYGTLIDWETGIIQALEPVLGPIANDNTSSGLTRRKVLDVVHELEAKQQTTFPDMLYADVLAGIYPALISRLNATASSTSTDDDAKKFGASVPHWPAFPDTVAALRRLAKQYKLVVLSNVDRESFSGTNSGPLEGVKFDMALTAQDIGSYKPDARNFTYMLEKVQQEFGASKDQVLQTAQSQFHDHQPAKKQGIRSAWIVRPGAIMGNVKEGGDQEIWDFKFDTLGQMADALEQEASGQW